MDADGPTIEAPTGSGRRFQRHAFVCMNEEACAPAGAGEVHKAMKEQLRAAGLKETHRVNKAGCFGQCGHGPLVVVYPEGVWYSHVTPDEARRIWSEHVVAGRPVEELRYRTPAPGTNVLGRQPDGLMRPLGGPRSEACTRCPPSRVPS